MPIFYMKNVVMMKRMNIMVRNSYCLYVILPEWVYVDMKAVTFIQTNLNRMKNKN